MNVKSDVDIAFHSVLRLSVDVNSVGLKLDGSLEMVTVGGGHVNEL